MLPKSFFGVLVDTCPDCAGIFFDEGEVTAIRSKGGGRAFYELDGLVQPCPFYFAPDEPNLYRKCPNCLACMRRVQYLYTSPITLDSCDSCGGVFIENGELQQMKAYLDAVKAGEPSDPKEVAANLDIHTIEQKDRARRLQWIAGAMAFYPIEKADHV
jgi:Zn-finger nucleic acid-binding protein